MKKIQINVNGRDLEGKEKDEFLKKLYDSKLLRELDRMHPLSDLSNKQQDVFKDYWKQRDIIEKLRDSLYNDIVKEINNGTFKCEAFNPSIKNEASNPAFKNEVNNDTFRNEYSDTDKHRCRRNTPLTTSDNTKPSETEEREYQEERKAALNFIGNLLDKLTEEEFSKLVEDIDDKDVLEVIDEAILFKLREKLAKLKQPKEDPEKIMKDLQKMLDEDAEKEYSVGLAPVSNENEGTQQTYTFDEAHELMKKGHVVKRDFGDLVRYCWITDDKQIYRGNSLLCDPKYLDLFNEIVLNNKGKLFLKQNYCQAIYSKKDGKCVILSDHAPNYQLRDLDGWTLL